MSFLGNTNTPMSSGGMISGLLPGGMIRGTTVSSTLQSSFLPTWIPNSVGVSLNNIGVGTFSITNGEESIDIFELKKQVDLLIEVIEKMAGIETQEKKVILP